MCVKKFKDAVLRQDLTVSLIYAQGLENLDKVYEELEHCTPLTYSVLNKVHDVVVALIALGADVNASDANLTPLQHAVHERSVETVDLLLDSGCRASLNWRNPLARGKDEVIVALAKNLLDRGADVNEQSENGVTPLSNAVHSGCLPLANFLIEHGAKADTLINNDFGLLHLAAILGNEEIMPLLLEQDLDINAQDKDGYTPLHHACDYDEVETAKLLINSGARKDIRTKNGQLARELNANDAIRVLFK